MAGSARPGRRSRSKAPLINGTLSTFLYVLSCLYYVLVSTSCPKYWTRNLIATVSVPFLGLLGGPAIFSKSGPEAGCENAGPLLNSRP